MSKVKNDYKKEATKLDKPSVKSTLENLKSQIGEFQRQAEYYTNMVLKAQGAIEVLTALESEPKED